jgi:hypothetical protein
MPIHTIILHYQNVMIQTQVYNMTLLLILHKYSFQTILVYSLLSFVASLSAAGDRSSARFIEGGGLKRSSSPLGPSPAVLEGPAPYSNRVGSYIRV